jgi:hypothetical protein
VWDLLWEAGREHGLIAAGLGAFDSLRLEKGYRLWGQDIGMEYDPISAGLGFAVKWDKDFQGREALERIRDDGPPKRLSAMTLDDPRAVVLGKEPIWHGDDVVSYVTSANYGFSIGKRDRLRLPAVGDRAGRHAGRGGVLRRADRGDGRGRPAVRSQGRTPQRLNQTAEMKGWNDE